MKKKKRIRFITFMIILALSLSSGVLGYGQKRVEPDNPILKETDQLRVAVAHDRGDSDDSETDKNDNSSEQKDKEERQQDRQKEKEPEKEKEKQKERNEQEEHDQENDSEQGKNTEDTSQEEDPSGDQSTGAGEEDADIPGDGEGGETEEEGLITDLSNRIITYSELENDTLHFYIYYSDPTVDTDMKVNYKHQSDSGTGTYLTSDNDKDYQTKLRLGKNYITVYYTNGDGERTYTRFILTYQADRADENHPEIGEHPPIIETNLDGWSGPIKTSEFTFIVDARTWKNERIYSNSIQVMMDGKRITNPTGSGVYEYELLFQRPNVGDTSNHTVTVLAWDEEGNSRFIRYRLEYLAHDEGEALGNVRVTIDATTVSCGIVDVCSVDVASGDTAATAVVKALEEMGYSYSMQGSVQANFYLRSISRADAFRGSKIEQRLKTLIERDGIGFTSAGSRDKLGEFDFTRGSGWMYFVNGSYAPGKAMSSWKLNGGENIALRFTLAYGKDLGAGQSGMGSLSSYCGTWVNGQVNMGNHNFAETSRVEPQETTDGYIEYTCTKCGEKKTEVLPATGTPEQPDPQPPEPEQPDPQPPEPEQPDPQPPEPEQPDPQPPEPEQPDPQPPEPEQPDPGQPEAGPAMLESQAILQYLKLE